MDLLQYDIQIKKALADIGAVHLRGILTQDADLDFFVCPEKAGDIVETLLSQGFFKVRDNDGKIQLQKILPEEVVRIDLVLTFDYIFETVPSVRMRQEFLDAYLSNPAELEVDFNALRYLFMERKQKKYLRYLTENRQEIIERDSFKRPLNINPFRNNISSESILDRVARSSKINVFPFLKLTHQIRYFGRQFRKGLSVFGSGMSVAVIGPDGSGKSTVVGYLKQTPWARSVYMGSNDYLFGNVYSKVSKRSFLPFRVGKFLAIYLENWLKVGRIYLHKLRGKTIYLDRYPSYQHFLQKGKIRWLFDLFYGKLFPKPSVVIILSCSEDMIIRRKNELTAQEIRMIYQAFKNYFGDSQNVYWIENGDLNKTVGEVLGKVREHANR